MLPFCGYHMGDYFAHWLSMPERTDSGKASRIYGVNWFRKDDDGTFLWPGYGDNSHVYAWICGRLEGDAEGVDTPIGTVPRAGDLDLDGLADAERSRIEAAFVSTRPIGGVTPTTHEHFETFGDRLPNALHDASAALEARLA